MNLRRLVVLVNIIAPSRIPILNFLSKEFDLKILTSGKEGNRSYWDEYIEENCLFDYKRVFGVNLKFTAKKNSQKFKRKYIHINPGYFVELVRLNPDYVISIEMGFRSLSALIYCTLFGKPLWIWWGGTLYTERHISYFKKLLRRTFKKYPRWISYGKSSTEYLLSFGISRDKIFEIQNAIDEKPLLKYEKKESIDLPHPIVLFVGELIERKGLPLLIESISRLKLEGLMFSLIVIGDGPERDKYVSQVEESGLVNIKFLGSFSPSDIPKYYHAADFMVFPSLHDVWGLVVNEALWSGLPVLSSIYAGASKDLLEDDYIFDPLNPQKFDEKMKFMFNNYSNSPDIKRLLKIEDISKMILSELMAVHN